METLNNAINNDSADRILWQLRTVGAQEFFRMNIFLLTIKNLLRVLTEMLFYEISTGQSDRHNQISNC